MLRSLATPDAPLAAFTSRAPERAMSHRKSITMFKVVHEEAALSEWYVGQLDLHEVLRQEPP